MSLRAKLLLAIVIVNLLVLASLSWLLSAQRRSFHAKVDASFEESFEREMPAVLQRFVERSAGTSLTIGRVLDSGNFGILCQDVMVVDLRRFTDEGGYLQFNPLGAWHRDPTKFPRKEVLAALDIAMREGRSQRVAGGFCMPIESRDGDVVGGGWFLPHSVPDPELPIGSLFLTLGIAVVALAATLYFGLERWVIKPLGRLGSTAIAFEEGRLQEVSESGPAAAELQAVMRGFERAGKQISAHQEELALAVEEATKRARARERELILSQRLAAIGTLAAGISHEINNPLGAMINAVRRLRRNPRKEDEIWLELLDEGLGRIGRIVRRTLDFAPRSTSALPFRIQESIERARALVAHRLEQQGVLLEIVDESAQEDIVLGDSHELSQVFLNLFLNSLDALSEGSDAVGNESPAIHLSISRVRDEEGARLLRVIVVDNGPGASEETMARIFDPFFSSKGATAQTDKLSSGLGMSISYSIVEQHGGVLRVSSELGKGFTAQIDLPLQKRESL